MQIPGLGPLTLDEDLGWYRSSPVAAGALGGAVGQVVLPEGSASDDELTAVRDAVVTFLTADDRALRTAAPDVFAYYLDTVRLVQEQGWDLRLPVVDRPESIWDHVSWGREFQVERDVDGQVYVSVECECEWEPEHGLQLVFRSGATVCKVGPFDGHLTNASAFARPDLEGVVYVSPFTTPPASREEDR